MSDRRLWLEEACPNCAAPAGARCRVFRYGEKPSVWLHWARGFKQRPCPTCKTPAGEPCVTPTGRICTRPHTARLHPSRFERGPDWVWDQLEQRDAQIATVRFFGKAGRGGRIDTVVLQDRDRSELERYSLGEGPLVEELAAPIWGRYADFRGQPQITATIVWDLAAREVTVTGTRGHRPFTEILLNAPPRHVSVPIGVQPTATGGSPTLPLSAASAGRVCVVCGRPLRPGVRREALYCSKRCRQAASRARIRVRTGRANLRPPERCAFCSGPMRPDMRPEARYCSRRCQHAASRARLRAAHTRSL